MLCLQKFSKSVLPPKTLSKYALTPHSVSLCISQPLSHHFRELTQITKSHARLFCHADFLALVAVVARLLVFHFGQKLLEPFKQHDTRGTPLSLGRNHFASSDENTTLKLFSRPAHDVWRQDYGRIVPLPVEH